MMGAMIMLLILIAWDIREQAISPAEAAAITQALTVEEADELRRNIDWHTKDTDYLAAQLAHAQEQAEEELADLQARLALAERETQKIKDELDRLEQLARQFDSQTSATPEEVEQLKRLLAQQQRRLAEAELELAQLRKDAAQKEKSYAIVPYRQPDGTFRRPIYIECRDNKIIIQPEGIELLPSDFQALDQPANPFDTALRTIRQYYIETEQIVRGSEPYPLLIVRPSGVEMFGNAMHATGNWVRDYGYEIVCEDWNILYPAPNEELRCRLQQQLATSRSRLSAYTLAQRTAGQWGGGDIAPRFRTTHTGEVVPVDGMLSSEDIQRYLAAHRDPSRAGGISPPVGWQETNPVSVAVEMVNRDEMQMRQDEARIQQMHVQHVQPPQPPLPPHQQQIQQMHQQHEQRIQRMQAQQPPLPPQQQLIQQMHQQQGQNLTEQPAMQGSVAIRGGIPQTGRPQNWALQGVTQFTTGISRYVDIRCEADRFVLLAQGGLARAHEIPIEGSVVTATDQLVGAIWEFQTSWDSAGANTHWRPILRVRVSPGGEQRLQELQALLRNSGLAVEKW